MTNNYRSYLQKSYTAYRSHVPDCVCEACTAKRNGPPVFRRKPESELTRRRRRQDGARNRCSTHHVQLNTNGKCPWCEEE